MLHQPTLDLELTGAEALWLINADAAGWDLPTGTEATGAVPVAADQALRTLPVLCTTATPVTTASVLRRGRWYASTQRPLAGSLAPVRGRMTCWAPRTKA